MVIGKGHLQLIDARSFVRNLVGIKTGYTEHVHSFNPLPPNSYVAGRFAYGVPRELLLARFEEILAPAIVEVEDNALAAA